MHIFFSGIGGTAIGPLAMIAQQAGFSVSGSDKQTSQYVTYLKQHGIDTISIGQTKEQIAAVHKVHPIDWFVYTSALTLENASAPELAFCKQQSIRISKRDEFLNFILEQKKLKLIAVAGTHGKTTTTSMLTWLFKELRLPISYSVGAKISFGEMGQYQADSKFFVYEADEFDRNFLSFNSYFSLITGVSWDHHEIYKTRSDYQAAFRDFIAQSNRTIIWQEDFDYLGLETAPSNMLVQATDNPVIDFVTLKGRYNRLDAWLAIQSVHRLQKTSIADLIAIMNRFPGLSRRMEGIVPGLFSDYAHTPEKIQGCMSVAFETAAATNQPIVVIYEPLTNRRQHYMIDEYKDCFNGASKLYWLPSYLAREDPLQAVISPQEMINHLSDPKIAEAAEIGSEFKKKIKQHLANGDMVVAMAGGGGNSLDEWLRREFTDK